MCMYCQLEEHGLCEQPARLEPAGNGLFYFACCCSASTNSDTRDSASVGTVGKGVIGRPPKDASDMEDVISTGRHRAARALPNIEGTPCHWRGLLYAGGGAVPIIGCLSGDASDRHHGPDKSVINNEVGVNLHALCDNCHARWHALNDPLYPNERPPEGKPFIPLSGEVIPHDSKTLATQAQIIASDMWWAMPIELRTSYESLRETENN